jgi:hypothetical protein
VSQPASELAARVAEVRGRIEAAARRAGRDPSGVRLMAVSKGFGVEAIARAHAAGLRCFGENRVQEAAAKIPQVQQLLGETLEWHFIGPLQRNKARRAAGLFDAIHSVDRPALAAELDGAARGRARRLPVLAQVNIDAEPQKSGVLPSDLPRLIEAIDACDALELIGLMAIPRACADPEKVRPSFARLRALRDELSARRPASRPLRELSMGMSADFEVAIEEGATWVRIGTAIFGERKST